MSFPIQVYFRMGGLYHGEVRIVVGKPNGCVLDVRRLFPIPQADDPSPLSTILGRNPWGAWIREQWSQHQQDVMGDVFGPSLHRVRTVPHARLPMALSLFLLDQAPDRDYVGVHEHEETYRLRERLEDGARRSVSRL